MTTTPECKPLGIDIGRDINLYYAVIDNLLCTKSIWKLSLKGWKIDRQRGVGISIL